MLTAAAPSRADLPVDEAVALLTAVADPHRLQLVRILRGGPRCVCALQEDVPLPGNRLSYHLKVLREAGLIAGTRRGRWIDYALTDGALDTLAAAVPSVTAPGAQPAAEDTGAVDGDRVVQDVAAVDPDRSPACPV